MANEGSESPSYDKHLIQLAIGKNSEIQLVKTIKLELKGGDKIDTRILVITCFRFFILTPNNKGPYKLDLGVHILDVHTIESKKPEQVVIYYGEKQVKFCLTKTGSANNVIAQLVANTKLNFPGGNLDESLRKDIEPFDKLESINNAVTKLTSLETQAEAGPCGGFSRSYSCVCDYHGVPFLEEVAWDIDTIYLSHDTKELNIQDFDHLEPRELIPIIATLEYNAWFTKLVCVSYKLSTELLDVIAKVIKKSTTLQELVLDGVSLGREFCQKLATALTSNPKSSLERIDLSNNPSAEDRGLTHLTGGLSKLSHGLESLNLHDTGLTNKGASTVSQMLKSSKYMSTSLTRFNISNNVLKVDGITVICDFLAQPNALTHLDLSSTECSVELIFGALIRGCCQNLASLNVSGNPFTNRKSKDTNLPTSFQQFFSSTAALREICLSECRLPADAVRAMFLGLIENNVVKMVDVDISKNELKSAGVRAMTGPLSQISNLHSLDLSDNGIESDLIHLFESLCQNKTIKKLYLGQNCNKGRNLNNIMEALIKLINQGNSPIEFLSLADSRLKQNITLLFDSLGTNENLIELDISGNMMGDEGARVLAKALQINNKLRTIHWDRNNVTQNGLRDIALALENNLTLQSMPTPITDVTLCLKPATEKALKQIEKCLLRNHSPSPAVTEQAYRLQQGLMMSSTQQQMVDKLIVQLQDTSTALRNSKDETVKIGLRDARRCINDADKLKQLFLKFHMCTNNKSMGERISSLANDIYKSVQQQMKENVERILDCAESNCPYVTGQEGVKESLEVACQGKANISKAFIDNVFLQQLVPIILNEVSEKKLNISTIVADAMMDKVIQQLEKHQAKLDMLVKEYKCPAEEKLTEPEENDENISEAAQKAKNRLSTVVNRRSTRFSDDENDVFSSPTHHKRRPTISRKRRTSDVEDRVDSTAEETKKKGVSVVISDSDLNVPVASSQELVHHTKNRARPARGRRPPTRPSAQQGAPPVGPQVQVDTVDVGLDNFFTKTAARPHSAVVSSNAIRDHALPKSYSVIQRPQPGSKKKNDKEDADENNKEHHEKKKYGILGSLPGIFKKRGEKDKKSPTAPRKQESKSKDHRKSLEDIVDGAPAEVSKRERKTSDSKSKQVEDAKPVSEKQAKPVSEKQAKPVSEKQAKPVSEKQAKRVPPEKPPKVEIPVTNEQEKSPPKQEAKPSPVTTPETSAESNEKNETVKEKEKEKENESESEEKTETAEPSSEQAVAEEPSQTVKQQPKAPPKFGVGLPMGPMGGDLLAEMKKRNERSNSGNKSSLAEPKPRQRIATNPDPQRPLVPVRPSSMKRSIKAKSASDLLVPAELDSKLVPKPKPRVAKIKEGNTEQEDEKEIPEKKEGKENVENTKPVPPKPLKEKPSVASRPAVPKRPPSIVKKRRSFQNGNNVEILPTSAEEKRKSVEVVPPTATAEEKRKSTEVVPPTATAEEKRKSTEVVPPTATAEEKRKSTEVQTPAATAEEKNDTTEHEQEKEQSAEEHEKVSLENAKDVAMEKPKDEVEKKRLSVDTPSEDFLLVEHPEKEDETVEKKTEDKDEENDTETNDSAAKDDNDNETTDVAEKRKSSSSAEGTVPSEDVTVGDEDDIVKSLVDVSALAEAIETSKDTEL